MLLHPPTNVTKMADKEDMWISKQEWEEQGSRALEKLGARGS
jgi:actin-related protein 2